MVAVARRKDRLDEVVATCHDAVAHAADVGEREVCEEVVLTTEERFGRVDVVVNNAGISSHRNAARIPADEIERIMRVNFFGPVWLTTTALPGMLERRAGAVVNITSVAASIPNPGESHYGASKAALSRWSHGLAVDLHGTGVHVGEVAPGPIDTEIWDLDEELAYTGRKYPPEVVAGAVAEVIRDDIVKVTVPRQYGAVGALYPLLGRPLRWGLRRYEERAPNP